MHTVTKLLDENERLYNTIYRSCAWHACISVYERLLLPTLLDIFIFSVRRTKAVNETVFFF